MFEPELTEDELLTKLLNLTQGEDSVLQGVIDSGNAQEISKLLRSIVSSLNKNSKDASERLEKRKKEINKVMSEGTVFLNGTIRFLNGTLLNQDDSALFTNGSIIWRNGTMIHPNGSVVINGTWTFFNQTLVNITEMMMDEERMKDRELVSEYCYNLKAKYTTFIVQCISLVDLFFHFG